jgi:hypothetical protein
LPVAASRDIGAPYSHGYTALVAGSASVLIEQDRNLAERPRVICDTCGGRGRALDALALLAGADRSRIGKVDIVCCR